MVLKVFNNYSGKKEKLELPEDRPVKIYLCGITPYSNTHLGHARPSVFWDSVVKYLQYKGLDVHVVQNVTDVNEKVLTRAKLEGISEREVAERYNREYEEVLEALDVTTIDEYPWVSDHIADIIDMVQSLIESEHAYQVDGDVYFDVTSFERYGHLSGQSLDELVAGARVEVDERKKHPADFALWKEVKGDQPGWSSPWGTGRPGWHIECSVLALKFLGFGFDFHAGGTDLIFPHHENEVAQSEAYMDDSPFAKCWVHHGMITGEDGKMSKSLGNFITVKDLLDDYRPEVVRHFLLSAHYSTPLKYSDDRLQKSKKAVERLITSMTSLRQILSQEPEDDVPLSESESETIFDKSVDLKNEFSRAMDDDLNTPQALAAVFAAVRGVNGVINDPDFVLSQPVKEALADFGDQIEICARILGIWPQEGISAEDDARKIDQLIGDKDSELLELLIEVRKEARQQKLWPIADMIRDRLQDMDIYLEDTPQGTRVKTTPDQ